MAGLTCLIRMFPTLVSGVSAYASESGRMLGGILLVIFYILAEGKSKGLFPPFVQWIHPNALHNIHFVGMSLLALPRLLLRLPQRLSKGGEVDHINRVLVTHLGYKALLLVPLLPFLHLSLEALLAFFHRFLHSCNGQRVLCIPFSVRELLKKKMQLNYGLLPKRSDPQPPPTPQTFGTFGTLFRRQIFFLQTFGTLFVSYFTKIKGKSAQLWGTKKCPKTFGSARNPPPPYGKFPN